MAIIKIPPEIVQFFNRSLLSVPIPKGDDAEKIKSMLDYVYAKIMRPEYKKHPRTIKLLILQFEKLLELYVRAKAKERENEGKTCCKTGNFFYRVVLDRKDDQEVLERFRRKV